MILHKLAPENTSPIIINQLESDLMRRLEHAGSIPISHTREYREERVKVLVNEITDFNVQKFI